LARLWATVAPVTSGVSSSRSRTLVIPDIHHQISAVDAVLAREEFDRVVFLGDYFDDFHDTPEKARQTAAWLKQRLADPSMIFLYGNHDLPYRYSAPGLECSGFSVEKREAILEVLDEDDWSTVRLHAWIDGFLITHAGWNEAFCDMSGRVTAEYIDSMCAECLADLDAGRMHSLVAAGRSRGGIAPVGGIVWQDWSELEPIAGLHQVVGHTPSTEIRFKETETGTAVCMDTRLCHVAVIQDGAISFQTTPVWDKWFGPQGKFPNAFR
jgi:hypothetical protein